MGPFFTPLAFALDMPFFPLLYFVAGCRSARKCTFVILPFTFCLLPLLRRTERGPGIQQKDGVKGTADNKQKAQGVTMSTRTPLARSLCYCSLACWVSLCLPTFPTKLLLEGDHQDGQQISPANRGSSCVFSAEPIPNANGGIPHGTMECVSGVRRSLGRNNQLSVGSPLSL